ncbi:MAG: dihydropteroate synthase [Actinomycetota bacterium]|nr:dihydropteroate synthase [Actinomycetota bacterium]
MLTLAELALLAQSHAAELALPAPYLAIGDRTYDLRARPLVMGSINLSRDSTYRESIATSAGSAVRKAKVMAAQGADLIDIGAESSTAAARRVGADEQIAALVPIVERLADEAIPVSVETYEPTVVRACLKAGARVLNLTGAAHQDEILAAAAEHEATVILCYVGGANVRDVTDVPLDSDPVPALIGHFSDRIALARARGVERIIIDPGMGFYYGNLVDPRTRAKHQAGVILGSFRLAGLGVPICNAMPHAFDLFEDQFRTAEGFFAVLGRLGGTHIFRTHEVAHVRAVLGAMDVLDS